MVLGNLAPKVAPMARGIATSAVRQAGHGSTRGIVGSNLPFQIENRYRLLFVACIYFSSGFALPFLTVRHQLLSKNQK